MRWLAVISILLILIIGSLIFGTSFIDRGCRYDPCREQTARCNEDCRQWMSSVGPWYNSSEILDIYDSCIQDCSNTTASCSSSHLIPFYCKYLSYKVY